MTLAELQRRAEEELERRQQRRREIAARFDVELGVATAVEQLQRRLPGAIERALVVMQPHELAALARARRATNPRNDPTVRLLAVAIADALGDRRKAGC